MNKELILKYKNEFNHWIDGGTLQVFCDASKKWNTYPSENGMMDINWSMEEIPLIVINDEYSFYRKALAEGKTVQFKPSLRALDLWYDFVDISRDVSDYDIELLRIKPEEPKFKVGDWVKDFEKIYQIKTQEESDYLNSKNYCCQSTSLWKPIPGNWCWNNIFGLLKILREDTENKTYICWNPWKTAEQKLSNLEPFIGELPSFLKDKQ